MDRVHFLQEDPDGRLVLCQPGFKDVVEARKSLSHLEPGTYHLISFSEVSIVVEPPPPNTKNLVKRGNVLATRAPSKNAKKGKKDKAEPEEAAA